jgi:hypothetical protein
MRHPFKSRETTQARAETPRRSARELEGVLRRLVGMSYQLDLAEALDEQPTDVVDAPTLDENEMI